MKKVRDRTPEIRRLEQAYARVDAEAAKKKDKITQKILRLKRESGMV